MAWIDVTDVKAHLNKAGNITTDDVELQGFIDSACTTIESLKGHVDVVTFIETHTPNSRGYVVLDERPLLRVVAVAQLLSDGTTSDVPPADPVTGVTGYEQPGGRMVVLPGYGAHQVRQVQVTYQAGLDPVPGNFRHAALDLVQHFWRKSQLNAGGNRRPRGNAYTGDNEQVLIPGSASALPYSVREHLGLFGKQVSDEVLFA